LIVESNFKTIVKTDVYFLLETSVCPTRQLLQTITLNMNHGSGLEDDSFIFPSQPYLHSALLSLIYNVRVFVHKSHK